MALVLIDRVQESATANTTISFTLSGANTGYQSFTTIGDGNTTYYGATDGTNWEVGIGTYTLSTTTLARTTILSSSNSGSAVSTFTSPVTVFVDYPSSKSVYQGGAFQGTIDNTIIGGTTPAAGTFTTITGQTEVLRGTGSNLLLQSQDFTNATWTKNNLTAASTSATTDPLGGLTADILTPNGTSDAYCRQTITPVLLTPYGVSVYAKAGTGNWLRFRALFINNNTTNEAWFNLSTGTLGTVQASVSATITSVGNGWYRCALVGSTINVNSASLVDIGVSNADNTRNNTNGQTIYVWGSQLELSNTIGNYVATTTTAVYGTPTLSFNGVAGLGLQSDGSFYISPAGTGALQAQATTSTTAGGNARGANAVDWQTLRGSAARIASGAQSVVVGGNDNTSSSTNAGVLAGSYNIASGFASGVVTGQVNIASGYYGFVGSGNNNTSSGYYSFVGSGYTNTTTSNSAVTTQSSTMNGTTAVTLSGSNASIKVGQFITGTYISTPYTYVAAISGTSLTLSQVASGSGTSTLSFFNPHGVVVGGGNNQATGSYSFIGGGGDAGTAANRNVASGDFSFVGGGQKNVASGIGSFVGGGGTSGGSPLSNTASGTTSVIAGGWNNLANASYSSILGGQSNSGINSFASVGGGQSNYANGISSTISGGSFGTARGISGYQVFPAHNSPISSAIYGASQGALLVLGRETTNATATILTSDTNAAGGANQIILPNNSAYYFRGEVVAGVTGGGNTKGWYVEGVIKRGANAGATAIVGTATVTSNYADAGASTWALTATADTTNGGLAITFTGQASTTIRCVAQIRTTEMSY